MALTLAQELELAELEALERARNHLLDFTLYTKPNYRVNWHHRNLAAKLDAFARGEIRFLMVFMPPRHGKSELVSRRLPAFLHGRNSNAEIFAVSYLDNLAGDMCKDVQKIIDTPEYKRVFPETRICSTGVSYVKGVRNTSEHTILNSKGEMYEKGKYRGQGVGGSFTGKGANYIIIDDPIKGREIADSEAFRERLWKFWKSDLETRLETDLESGHLGQVLITQTRWHEDDLSGRLMEEMKRKPDAMQFEIIEYPAERVSMDDPSDPRQIGEALWPLKYPTSELAKFKVDERAWSSLFQQRPYPVGGAHFKREMFKFGPMPSHFDWTFIVADTAYKDKQDNDYTVFTHFGVKDGELYIIRVWRAQIKAVDVETYAVPFILEAQRKWGFRGVWVEPKGHGIYLNQMLPRKGCVLPPEDEVEEFFKDRKGDKVERANDAIPRLVGHVVTINEEIAEKEELLAELMGFPRARHDDFVDTVIDGTKIVFDRALSICDVL